MRTAAEVRAGGALFGHPPSLLVLSLTGACEAFALFAMRSVLVYYLAETLRYSDADAIRIYSFSTSAALLMGLAGGLIADRLIGRRRAILSGALLMALGSLLLTPPGLLLPALGASALGYGLFRPTLSAAVGALYAADDPAMNRGFIWFSVICNIGGALAPFAAGLIGQAYGWKWVFIASTGIMLAAALIFWAGRGAMGEGRRPAPPVVPAAPEPGRVARSGAMLVLIWLGAVLTWAAYNQIGGAVALWAARDLDLDAGGFHIPPAWFQAVNPILFLALAPLVSLDWRRRARPASVARDVGKMALGAGLIGACYLLLAAVASGASATAPAPWVWLVVALAPFTLGELLFSPLGQSVFSRLAPAGIPAFVMSIWFLTLMFGFLGAGLYGALWGALPNHLFFAGTAAVALAGVGSFILAGRLARARAA